MIHAWAPWVWGTTKSALYKYTYLYLLPITNKTRQFKQEVLELSSLRINAWVQRRDEEHKTSNSCCCWIRGNLTIHFRQGNVGTHIRRGGQYISYIVGNLLRCHSAKNYRNRLTFDWVIAETNRVPFWDTLTQYRKQLHIIQMAVIKKN